MKHQGIIAQCSKNRKRGVAAKTGNGVLLLKPEAGCCSKERKRGAVPKDGNRALLTERGKGCKLRHMNYTYLLRCRDGSLYCGWTNDPEKRLAAHNAGTASKYTASRRPVELVYLETFETKQEAMKREAVIKKMSRREKLKLMGAKTV